MSLLVLGPDIAAVNDVKQQLTDLGYDSFTASDSQDAVRLCAQGGVRLVVCAKQELIPELTELPPGVGFVYASHTPLELPTVLSCLEAGVHDCWQLPIDSADLNRRMTTVLDRIERWMSQANAEMHGMRVELERDQRAGQYIQLGMLPPNPMGIGHFRLQHRVEPSLILSGDFVDYFQITERYFACYVADVAGHGASSAFVTVLLKNFSRRLRREYRQSMLKDPGEVLAWINNELIDQQIDKHVAMFFGIVDVQDDVLHYSNAAHFPPAMLVGPEGLVSLEQKGKPLGIFADAKFDSLQVKFPQGSRIVVFSDGVLDLISATTLEDKEQKLLEAVRNCDNMESLWASLDVSKLGQDDVSCLFVSHGS
jgi:sigma-B regulation protein RsbU (phosphoserine phosphatase)